MFNNEFNNIFGEPLDPYFDNSFVDNDFDFYDFHNMSDLDNATKVKTILPTYPTSSDILNWICLNATDNCINYEELDLQKYANIDGQTFESMSEADFIELADSSTFGKTLFESKENYLHQNSHEMMHPRHLSTNIPRTCSESSNLSETVPVKRRPGRPRTKTAITKKNDKRYGKLWEFLIILLFDKKTCPSLIKWVDYNLGTFKFVHSAKVAELWGRRKNNETMDYGKFSRALRYHYQKKALLPVVGKRLVYQFGPTATGWRARDPILET